MIEDNYMTTQADSDYPRSLRKSLTSRPTEAPGVSVNHHDGLEVGSRVSEARTALDDLTELARSRPRADITAPDEEEVAAVRQLETLNRLIVRHCRTVFEYQGAPWEQLAEVLEVGAQLCRNTDVITAELRLSAARRGHPPGLRLVPDGGSVRGA